MSMQTQIRLIRLAAYLAATDDPPDRTGIEGQHGPVRSGVGDHRSAVRLGDVQLGGEAPVAERSSQPAQVVADLGRDVDGGHCGRGPLVLPPLRSHVMAHDDRDIRQEFLEQLLHLEFVEGIDVGVDERDRHRLVLSFTDGFGDDFDRVRVQRG